MKVLGVSAHYHDAAAALVVDGELVASVQEERISRKKNDAAFPLGAIEWCLDYAGVDPAELDAVVFYEKPLLKFERIVTTALRAFPRSWRSFPKAMQNMLGEKVWVKGLIASHLGVPRDKILFTEHHQAHAAAAFLSSPSRAAAILTADGVGEWATLTIGRGERRDDGSVSITVDRELRFPHSLGMLYSTFTAYLGFEVNEGEYKVMGLASYGTPRHADLVHQILRPEADGSFELDLSYFDFHTTAERSFSQRLIDELGPPRAKFEPLDPSSAEGARWADIAASVQFVLEYQMVSLARTLHAETGLPDLCLGGGVALNGCANARILRESGFSRVFVPPAPGDAGCAAGAALYVDRTYFKTPDRPHPQHSYLGPEPDGLELARAAGEDGYRVEMLADEDSLLDRVADLLAAGNVVGWIQGRSELGPRALGNRSILAAPTPAGMRDRLNRAIKFREEFRPFAPAVPAEHADRYFELPPGGVDLARYMSGVFPVRHAWRTKLAAVTHVDGTARLQTVDREVAPLFHRLLERYGQRSGVPVLLNTSFNLAGEPIVNRAIEGYSTFCRSGIDVLVVDRCLVAKEAAR